eukprot:Gregarina_sp_Pseudo_9__5657@NODE_797_length_2206_cov_19_226119_g751_i0_p1_GENE_NODE_797_length_2206_cov_19_226119_g751_i0NODE_797_length_2206_cov_19_226119_g751_i0_p1_ORF_typecomplete_len619_score68_68HSP70/PF00012_20/3e58MreB_Mbl/PF06723_13/3_2e13FGGY_N/PF00370_21/0_32FGGY_N/PF00370_21/3_1e02FGGY_N/PF00370_21/7_6e02FGGY_N/PF00370_21/7_2e03FGGY_C/PF02782_16/6_3e02FGGY_C/PF02782_16/0_91_NODE_797_length_2206_cov_19_226119_g751_i0661922
MSISVACVVGIDFGTTNVRVSVCGSRGPEIITSTWSCVAFTPDSHHLGEAAKLQACANPDHTFTRIKRSLGQPGPYTRDGEPGLSAAMLLEHVLEAASNHLNARVTEAVISVPTRFDQSQREVLIAAGRAAGLDVVNLIDECVAATLAYKMETLETNRPPIVLEFCLGGGFCEAAMIRFTADTFQFLSHADSSWGGEDLDDILVLECKKDLEPKDWIPHARACLKTACEEAKKSLTKADRAYINFDKFEKSKIVTIREFERSCKDFNDKCMRVVNDAVLGAGLNPAQIDAILFVGGSSRIPSLRARLCGFASNARVIDRNNVNELVAIGAAICADNLRKGQGSMEERLGVVRCLALQPTIDKYRGRLKALSDERKAEEKRAVARNELEEWIIAEREKCKIDAAIKVLDNAQLWLHTNPSERPEKYREKKQYWMNEFESASQTQWWFRFSRGSSRSPQEVTSLPQNGVQREQQETRRPLPTQQPQQASTSRHYQKQGHDSHTTIASQKQERVPSDYHTTIASQKQEQVPSDYHTTTTFQKQGRVTNDRHTTTVSQKQGRVTDDQHTTTASQKQGLVTDDQHTTTASQRQGRVTDDQPTTTASQRKLSAKVALPEVQWSF